MKNLKAVGVAAIIAVAATACGGGSLTSNGNDGRKTKYDNVRVQVITLTPAEGGGSVVCISDYQSGIALSCDWPAR